MLSDIQLCDTLMFRGADSLEKITGVLSDKRDYELRAMSEVSEHILKCLDIVGDMINNRDMADDTSVALYDQAVEGLKMIIDKQIKRGE